MIWCPDARLQRDSTYVEIRKGMDGTKGLNADVEIVRAYELFMISLIETCCVKNGTCKRGLDVIAREFTSCLITRLMRLNIVNGKKSLPLERGDIRACRKSVNNNRQR